jgi:hypothetical protein
LQPIVNKILSASRKISGCFVACKSLCHEAKAGILLKPALRELIFLIHILQLPAKYARRAEVLPQKAKFGVNPDQNAMHFASAHNAWVRVRPAVQRLTEGKFYYCKIWV